MVLFKINGERNSGTNFIERILKKNNIPVFVQLIKGNIVKYWKHGVPISNKNIDTDVVDIFIFRDLKEWLVSMYKNPYELEESCDFKYFLERKHVSKTNWLDWDNKKHVNYDDNDKTIFEIRYHKISSIMKYCECNSNIVFVNLSYLQENSVNTERFIQALCKTYLNINKQNIISVIPHTKTSKNIKNQIYDININNYTVIINRLMDTTIEEFVSNLTFTMKT